MSLAKRFSVVEPCPRRAYTRDAWLTSPTPAETAAQAKRAFNSEMLGRVYDGYRKLLDAQIDGNRRAAVDAIAEMQRSLSAYGNELGNGTSSGAMRPAEFGSLAVAGDVPFLGSGAAASDVQRANDRHYGRASASDMTRPTSIADINANNRTFYTNREPFRFGREFGKG
jgi:hypothetical protein